jgi:hypothetical protein
MGKNIANIEKHYSKIASLLSVDKLALYKTY